MQQYVARFRDHVIHSANDSRFLHHRWFVRYHLEIVARLAEELCALYPAADRDLVTVLAWLHDYGKIVDQAYEHAATLTAGRAALLSAGFSMPFIDRVLACAERIDTKDDLAHAPIEVQIISSADGASHLVGPFYALWWYENAHKPFAELMADNAAKARYDWERKIVLPEVRAAFARRHRLLLERCGQLPERFIISDGEEEQA